MYAMQHEVVGLSAGCPFPQGAMATADGVNFSIFAEGAEAVDLCLFDTDGREERRIRMPECTTGVWHCHLSGIAVGQAYGYRVHGPYEPERGLRFNPNKVLLDPYAKGLARPLEWDDSLFGYSMGDPSGDLSFDSRDSAPFASLGCVVDHEFDWEGDQPPRRPWYDSIIYEAHVKGATMRHPEISEKIRGTYAGMASAPFIRHLQKLGVTALELMPVHHFLHDRHLIERGQANYWGYNTLGFFIPEPSYASSPEPRAVLHEFKSMVKTLHQAGIEVILDVVYNHTAEGDQRGPTLSLRGIDNLAYYRTTAERRYYMDYTGCGNTLNLTHPQALRLIVDSLRYWVTEMHIDGFRFDLASALARELHEVNQLGAFMNTIYQDPVLANVKLIAEPWDLGDGGYQVGNFPVNWTEWNGMFRDTIRRFWKGEQGQGRDLTLRISGSADLYAATGRKPSASINFITAHDGFTLKDLVSHESKHNEANGDDNEDGTDDNFSWNRGEEGKTEDPRVRASRIRDRRNLMASLLLSQGVPMISGGDEIGRTQAGNNNGYCHDGPLTWLDWTLGEEDERFLDYCGKLSNLRKRHPNFRRHSYEKSDPQVAPLRRSLEWYRADGTKLDETADDPLASSLALYLNGSAPEIRTENGIHKPDDDFLLLFNASAKEVGFCLPAGFTAEWRLVFDTFQDPPFPDREADVLELPFVLAPSSLVLLRHAR